MDLSYLFIYLFLFFTGILELRRVRLQFRQFCTFHPGASEKQKTTTTKNKKEKKTKQKRK